MELFLNLAWLLLIVPACFLWRSARRGSAPCNSSFVLLALACILAILFPVVSASDDIQAMRPEVEEASSRDAITNPHHPRISGSLQHSLGGPALLDALVLPQPEFRACGSVALERFSQPIARLLQTPSGRGPPAYLLA